MTRSIIAAAVMLLCAGTVTVGAEESSTKAQHAEKNSYKFMFKDINGVEIPLVESAKGFSFPSLENKKIIIMFYLATGTPCQNELHIFEEMLNEDSNLEVIAFELKGFNTMQLKNFAQEHKLEKVKLIDAAQSIPFAQHIASIAGWQGSVPLLIIVEKNGVVKYSQVGAMTKKELTEKLR